MHAHHFTWKDTAERTLQIYAHAIEQRDIEGPYRVENRIRGCEKDFENGFMETSNESRSKKDSTPEHLVIAGSAQEVLGLTWKAAKWMIPLVWRTDRWLSTVLAIAVLFAQSSQSC